MGQIELFKIFLNYPVCIEPSWLGLLNIPTESLKKDKTLPKSVLDMTLNNLMVRLQ